MPSVGHAVLVGVNQNQTFRQEIAGGCLQSRKRSADLPAGVADDLDEWGPKIEGAILSDTKIQDTEREARIDPIPSRAGIIQTEVMHRKQAPNYKGAQSSPPRSERQVTPRVDVSGDRQCSVMPLSFFYTL
ncbi:MAG TPA: hypothetical protein VH351_08105 [Bryobacteraceae bacterium]|nr:hypothetical protein [Bryobacteraceae bacterium]